MRRNKSASVGDHIKAIRIVGLLLLVALIAPTGGASATGPIISGTVKNMIGQPLAGATVSDGTQSTTTNPDGAYTLIETQLKSYAITASMDGYVSYTKIVDTRNNISDVNFDLYYSITPTITPRYFNVVPQTLNLKVLSKIPTNAELTAGLPDGSTVTMTNDGIESGKNRWVATTTVPTGTPDAIYRIHFEGRIGGALVTEALNPIYVLDRVSPAFGDGFATPNGTDTRATRSTEPILGAALSDDRSGVNPSSITAEIRSLAGSLVVSGAGVYNGSQATYSVTTANSLPDGFYSVSFTASDRSGNVSSASFPFVVDTQSPVIHHPIPNDDVADSSPMVSVNIANPGPAPLNAPSMKLNGVSVSASYSSTQELMSYPSPSLVAGEYVVKVTASDGAGNAASMDFSFWILPVVSLSDVTRGYSLAACPAAGVSLVSLFGGRAITVQQDDHRSAETAARNTPSRYLHAEPLNFMWTPGAGNTNTHEIIAGSIPEDTSRPRSLLGQRCLLGPDPHSSEWKELGNNSYERQSFGPSRNWVTGTLLAPGSYNWRVRNSAASSPSATDKFVVASVIGSWADRHQHIYTRGSLPLGWESVLSEAMSRWNSVSSFQYSPQGRCGGFGQVGCDAVNSLRAESLGTLGPLGFTNYKYLATSGASTDQLECCFEIFINTQVPVSISRPLLDGSFDLFSIFAHELGHGAGIGHDFNSPASVMHNTLGAGWIRQHINDFDSASLRYLYP